MKIFQRAEKKHDSGRHRIDGSHLDRQCWHRQGQVVSVKTSAWLQVRYVKRAPEVQRLKQRTARTWIILQRKRLPLSPTPSISCSLKLGTVVEPKIFMAQFKRWFTKTTGTYLSLSKGWSLVACSKKRMVRGGWCSSRIRTETPSRLLIDWILLVQQLLSQQQNGLSHRQVVARTS